MNLRSAFLEGTKSWFFLKGILKCDIRIDLKASDLNSISFCYYWCFLLEIIVNF